MTRSTHPEPASRGARALRAALAISLVFGLSAALGCAGHGLKRHHGKHGFTTDVETVQIISAEVGGKNVFIPGTIVVPSGRPVTLSIWNTTEKEHGFSIPALGIAKVVPVGEEFPIELPALDGHQLLQIRCHLHGAHRTAVLMVVPAKASEEDAQK